MKELLHKRTPTSKIFEKGNHFQGEFHIGHIHYRDGVLKNGSFQEIDTTLRYNDVSQKYSMTNASYEAEVGLLGSIRFHNINHSIEFALANPNSVQAEPYLNSAFGQLGKGLIWKNILQTGGHQIVEARNGSLAKIFRFESVPNSNVISFSVSVSGGVKLLQDAVELRPLLQEARTSGVLNLESGGLLSWIRKPKAWNHRGEYSDIELRWYRVGTTIYVDKIIPQSFINNTFTEQGAWLECDTTTSYYAGAGDGHYSRYTGAGESWSSLRDSAGNGSGFTDTEIQMYCPRMTADSGNPFQHMVRIILPTDTSGLTADATIISAGVVVYMNSKIDAVSTPWGWGIDHYTSAAYAVSNWDSTNQAPQKTYAGSPTLPSYTTFSLNATGLANINKTGTTQFGIRGAPDIDNSAPTWESGAYTRYDIAMSETTGTNKDPYLSVTYLPPGVSGIVNFSRMQGITQMEFK